VGTAKRERQKANRQAKLEQLEKDLRKKKAKSRGLQFGIGIPVAVIILVIVVILVNRGDDNSASPADSVPTSEVTDNFSDDTVVDDTAVDDTAVSTTLDTTPIAPDCPKEDGTSEKSQAFTEAPGMCIDTTKVYVATVTTNKGEFTVELDPGIAPKTVNNFVFLARYHYFDGISCHRIIPGFVVQCGDPTGTGSGGPGYAFADELPAAGAYKLGSLAMANSGADTNGSQFFIITGDNGVGLPPQYSLFGQTIAGFDTTVKAMEAEGTPGAGTPKTPVTILSVTVAVKEGVSATGATTDTTAAATTTAAPATTTAG